MSPRRKRKHVPDTDVARLDTLKPTVLTGGLATRTAVVAVGNIVLAIVEGTSKKGKRRANYNLNLAICNGSDGESDDWILDSVSSRHLVNNASLVQVVRYCELECHLADGEGIKLSRSIAFY
uniref:Uncharacterized protein n=1 Tax=Peronospora matthiolae TaxID=2874970 RepID=A0AAV1USN1_9STRA